MFLRGLAPTMGRGCGRQVQKNKVESFFRNKAVVRTAARRGLEDEPQGNEAGFEFVPGQIFRRRDFQETGQKFFLLRHRQN